MAKNTRKHGEQTREKIYNSIISYIGQHGYPPTIQEIGEMVGLKSKSSVSRHLLAMKDKGIIETDTDFGAPRAIRVPGYKFVKENSEGMGGKTW